MVCVWARRNGHSRWLGKQFNDVFGVLKIRFTNKAETISTLSVYSRQIQFGQTPKFRYHCSGIPQIHPTVHLSLQLPSFAISYGGLLDTSWDQFICTPWPCDYIPISTFPGRSGTLVPVTHAARECTASDDLRSLAQSRQSRVRPLLQEDGINVFVLENLKITRRDSRRLGNLAVRCDGNWSHQGRRGKRTLGALSDCKVTIMIIKYSVRFSCSICGHRFHQISNFGDKMQYCVLITMKTGNYSPAAIGTYSS